MTGDEKGSAGQDHHPAGVQTEMRERGREEKAGESFRDSPSPAIFSPRSPLSLHIKQSLCLLTLVSQRNTFHDPRAWSDSRSLSLLFIYLRANI